MAKQKRERERLLEGGKKKLAEWEVSLEALEEGRLSLAAVEERVGQDKAADLALVALLGDYPSSAAARVLLSLEDKIADKALRREIHRSLYKLSQKGVVVERPQPQVSTPILAPVEPEGYLSPFDGRGDRLIWLVKPRVGGGLHYLSAIVNEPEGMRDVDAVTITRKALRQMRRELEDQHHIVMVAADWRYCDFLMHQGYERAQAQKRDPVSYPALRSHLVSSSPAGGEPLIYRHLDPAAIEVDTALVEDSARFLEEQELQGWFLDKEQAGRYLEQITEARESPLILNRYQQQDRVLEIINRAVVEVFSDEGAMVYARRLEETAFYLFATGREAQARRALATALALKKSEKGGRGIPFCEELIRRSIALYYDEKEAKEKEQASGLIMKPQEFAALMQARRRQPL
ncbi:MAG: hypothetical protein HYZ72_05490 [Deltaproteobacteria bacterium]|nr:hypothetical protein [Deltaproteobacteria bacterium]